MKQSYFNVCVELHKDMPADNPVGQALFLRARTGHNSSGCPLSPFKEGRTSHAQAGGALDSTIGRKAVSRHRVTPEPNNTKQQGV